MHPVVFELGGPRQFVLVKKRFLFLVADLEKLSRKPIIYFKGVIYTGK